MPKKTIFERGAVLRAALDVVREHGWDALTARAVAGRLGASVAPVYSALGSMERLFRETLKEIRGLLEKYTAGSYSEIPFLNIGAGMVLFARDEPMFFQALFQSRHPFQDLVGEVDSSILSWMKSDASLGLLSDASRGRLYDNIGFYTMGLAAAVAAGRLPDASTENIIRLLKNMGNIAMFAEVSGTADFDSPENRREWTRIVKEKNLPVSASDKPVSRRTPDKKRAARRGAKRLPSTNMNQSAMKRRKA